MRAKNSFWAMTGHVDQPYKFKLIQAHFSPIEMLNYKFKIVELLNYHKPLIGIHKAAEHDRQTTSNLYS